MSRVLVTGASGFVGTALCESLASCGHIVRAALRSERVMPSYVHEKVVIGDLAAPRGLADALREVDCVMHLAARTHVLHDSPGNAALYDDANAHGTRHLAEAAAAAGVRRFVYLSSIKANGEETHGRPYRPDDDPAPRDPYGSSKLQGERFLWEVAAESTLQAVVVRPPLVYGPGVRANFLRLMRWIERGVPLPFGAIHNQRSLVCVWNLCSLLLLALDSPAAPGRVWMVSDADDLSTPELIRRIGRAMQCRVLLLPVPEGLLAAGGAVLGRKAEVMRLTGSLVVDIGRTRTELGWSPAVTVDEALTRTVRWYREQYRNGGS
jgi:nucleoside-diphosphate-sugar epimerase